MRTEAFFLTNGNGNIDLKGNGFDCVIYFKGSPYALNWCDCSGSVGQILVRSGIKGFKSDLQHIRHTVEHGLKNELSIAEQIYPLLKLFKNGQFSLKCYVPEDWNVSDSKLSPQVEYYPFGETYVPTQSFENLDQSTVKKYVSAIKSGSRPLVITASVEEGWCEFVIDGHHKLSAYKKQKIAPTVLCIAKASSYLEIEEGLRILMDKPSLETYKRVKSKYG